ncbi:hypothetical protein BJ508DRAFT_415818 [Ascobolus immersus RN42]|uniref:Complex 1 LYR protein domain-containing protein n=1 Tax=Ascobolus immersus RN42 TaxID=1160509 RepID=A0A3N4I2P0_ASCIM|nr:hypothetical protein BJ508DRAFT_415818 [Ascobolus immersus RN42]
MSTPNSAAVRSLYRSILRTGHSFANYNFRSHAHRLASHRFHEHAGEKDPAKIKEFYEDGVQNLKLLKRQTIISQMYQSDKLVLEGGNAGQDASGGRLRQRSPQGWD